MRRVVEGNCDRNARMKSVTANARRLRKQMTLPEVLLWQALRSRPGNFKFRRQHPLGPYVLDFFCPAARLAVEVDGMAHDLGSNPQRDHRRDEWLRSQAVKTLRLPASDVLKDVEKALNLIVGECAARSTPEI